MDWFTLNLIDAFKGSLVWLRVLKLGEIHCSGGILGIILELRTGIAV